MDSHALTTKERIKTRLELTATTFDDLFDSLILAVTDRIERMCNRRFMQATYTNELYDGSDPYGSRRFAIFVRNAPINAITSIEWKGGLNSNPVWTAFSEDDYDADLDAGIIYFNCALPRGKRNIRISYTGGYTAFTIGVANYWVFDATPAGTVDGSNRTFTLPEAASQIIVYPDGIRAAASGYSFTSGDDSFTFNDSKQPFSTISVDYLPNADEPENDDTDLPLDIVEVCEEAVVRLFKRRSSEGRSSETFEQSSITWTSDIFSDENQAVIRSYRRASLL
jgi:hypothetical protein